MAHSHLVVHHLMKQLELKAARRDRTDYRPQWLSDAILRWSAVFEPYSGVGRIGFVCEPDETGWNVRLYLGTTEIVGGREDGEWKHPGFELDFAKLTDEFAQIEEFRWNVSAPGPEGTHSFINLRGVVHGDLVQLKIYSRPPRDAGPAFRQLLDGTIEPVAKT